MFHLFSSYRGMTTAEKNGGQLQFQVPKIHDIQSLKSICFKRSVSVTDWTPDSGLSLPLFFMLVCEDYGE